MLCDILEAKLNTQAYIVGDQYTLADIVWTVFISRLFMLKMDNLILERKALALYWQRMQNRPSFAQAAIWTKMKPKMILKVLLSLFL